MADTVNIDSLGWALTHIERYGDTDLFPVPFEYSIIKTYWGPLLQELGAINLEKHVLSPSNKLMLPKPGNGYRAITQLDPLDTILLTGAIYEAAPLVEAYRIPKADRVDCAFRVSLTEEGQLFSEESGWRDFSQKAAELILKGQYRFVLCVDIADYYTQASHHKIQNALSKAGVETGRSNNLEAFLFNINSRHHSKGIPVGPTAGVVLAEVCLADVDAFLMRKKYIHTRYVDDFRIFCLTRSEVERAFHDISEYLFTAHRLTLQQSKTRILDVESFCRDELMGPEEQETEAKRVRINNLLDEKEHGDYEEVDEDIDESELSQVGFDTLNDLFGLCLEGDRLPAGLAKYVLRKAAKMRSKIFMQALLQRLPRFVPVIRDTMQYLIRVTGPRDVERVGSALLSLANESEFGFLPIVRLWVIEAFCRKPSLAHYEDALGIAEGSGSLLCERLSALVAKYYGMVDWVRERKETWANYGPWAHRAILFASTVLPDDERKHWLKSAHSHPMILTRAVAKCV